MPKVCRVVEHSWTIRMKYKNEVELNIVAANNEASSKVIDKKINALNQKITDLNNKIDNLIALFQTHKHTYHVMAFKEVTTFGDLRNQINQNLSGSDKKLIGLQIHGVDVQTSPPK